MVKQQASIVSEYIKNAIKHWISYTISKDVREWHEKPTIEKKCLGFHDQSFLAIFKKHHSDIEESTSIHEIDIIDINLDLCKYSFQIIDNWQWIEQICMQWD